MTTDLAVAGPTGLALDPFSLTHFTIRRPFWSIFGRTFKVYGPGESLVLYVKHPMFSFSDEWTVWADESETRALITVKLRKIISLDITHDVYDARTGALLGAFRMQKLKSIVRDTWDVLDAGSNPVGVMQEDSMGLLRRFVPLLLGHWHLSIGEQIVAQVDQVFRFFVKEFTLDTSSNGGRVDPRVAIAGALLALRREIHRENSG